MKLLLGLIALVGLVFGSDNDLENVFEEANDRFTANFFNEVVKENPGKSTVLSPYSVLLSLALIATGAEGESHDELLSNIFIPNDNVTKVVFPIVNNKLRAVKGPSLKTATGLYVADGYQLKDEFTAVSRDVFDSDSKSVDFTHNVETARAINTWVEDKTNNRIKDLVDSDSLDSDTRAVLVNAIYFKGLWKDKFDAALTTDHPFHVTKNRSVTIPMMYRNGRYNYGMSDELDAEILELPCEGDEVSFVIVRPNEIDGLSSLSEKIKEPLALLKALENTRNVKIFIHIPKFKIESTTNLKNLLSNIGIKKIFNPSQAGLSKILNSSDQPLYISEATQKAFIEVNEEGAEAAAANVVRIVPKRLYIFKADRPFLFAIKWHNIVLFVGTFVG